jgi:septal ring factor EnvC (AmiA/AmiB activator)
MQKACEIQKSTMAAIIGLDDKTTEDICKEVADNGKVVVAANYNCPGQIVISGSMEGIEEACAKLKDAGAKRALPLSVSGAFHSPLMQPAKEELEAARPLVEQVQTLTEQLEQMRNELNEALAQNGQLSHKLAQCEEKSQSARAEMMAAEERLVTREQELTQRNERLAALEARITQYEAVLGRCDGMKEHMDSIVRPFTESASRRAEDTLDNTYALITALLAQLGELQGGIEEQKRALRQEKAESDARLSTVLNNWFSKAKELADTTVDRATHFFR